DVSNDGDGPSSLVYRSEACRRFVDVRRDVQEHDRASVSGQAFRALSAHAAPQTSSWPLPTSIMWSSTSSLYGRPMICGCIVRTHAPPRRWYPRNSPSQIARTSSAVEIFFVQLAPSNQKCAASSRIHWIGTSTSEEAARRYGRR